MNKLFSLTSVLGFVLAASTAFAAPIRSDAAGLSSPKSAFVQQTKMMSKKKKMMMMKKKDTM